jgi:hypothetical protein
MARKPEVGIPSNMALILEHITAYPDVERISESQYFFIAFAFLVSNRLSIIYMLDGVTK